MRRVRWLNANSRTAPAVPIAGKEVKESEGKFGGRPPISSSPTFKSASRQQQSLLAAHERRVLIWLAHRMPRWVAPDHLTLLGFAAMFFAGVSYYIARFNKLGLIAVIVCLAVNWFGDSLDGTLARVREKQRPRYGFYVDHVVDAFGTLFLIGGLGLSGYMSPGIAMALLLAYYLVSIEVYLATYTIGVFRLSFGWWGPTELRILLCIGNLVLLYKPMVTIAGQRYLLCDVGAVVAIIGLLVAVIVSTIRNTIRLYNEERLP
ncbi:MAG: CDP-alcohol phosphatidyltransferase family protein [Acidobacteria bacterium]|nr:CDP-alcohol phosphatidyltransferase family protein [Acidobacteriota bacterium]